MSDVVLNKAQTTGENVLSNLLKLLPKLPSLESLRLPEISKEIESKGSELLKYKDLLHVLQTALGEKRTQKLPNLK